MRVVVSFTLILWGMIAQAQSRQSIPSYTSFVDPMIGSGGHGHLFVGASVPFGAVQVGPDNIYKGWDWCSGYNYGDSLIIGFAQTHLSGTGIGDLADVLIMPYTGDVKLDKGSDKDHLAGYGSRFKHSNEKAIPGYYSVLLDRYGIQAELTASARVGFHRYHFPKGGNARVLIDLKEGINDQSYHTFIRRVDAYTLEGCRFSKGWAKDQWLFFAIRSSLPIPQLTLYDDRKELKGDSASGKSLKGLITFDKAPETLQLKVGISPVSAANALANIDAEIPHWDFEKVKKDADAQWNKELSTIDVETRSLKDKKIFYTALYHTMINPSLFNDHNGEYRGADKKVYKTTYNNYSVFSLWDTYRATHPLFVLTQPQRTTDMIRSMLDIFDQQGKLPIWHLVGNETGTMVGISSMQVIAEAYLKGIKGFDAERAFKAIKSTAMSDSLGVMYIRDLKYIPQDVQSRSVAKGLEYAISDGSIALMAKRMNKTDDYNYFQKRAGLYKQYYNPATQFFQGRLANGEWAQGFNPTSAANRIYAEGNAWQYLWLVPQDVKGFTALLGGEEVFNRKLDSLFSFETTEEQKGLVDLTGAIGQYAHGNEPSHHIAYLYAYSGLQWKTAEKVRTIMRDMYHDQPDGIIGNEDCGQMSAWYIFSSLGFYPVFPASEQYVIGSPIFDKASINLAGGKQFTVNVVNNSEANIYVQSIELNKKPYSKSYILHRDIINGGNMKIVMGSKPNPAFGKMTINRP